MSFQIRIANENDNHFAEQLSHAYAESAKQRGIGIAFRSKSYIQSKMNGGDAIIALTEEDELAGFCYIETFENKKYVSNSGLLVLPEFRGHGLAKKIKLKTFGHSRKKYPHSKVFSITTSNAVMKMNSDLGYRPVAYSELTSDDVFWANCQTCRNYDILTRNNREMCMCTGMLYDKLDKTQTDDEEE